MRPPLSRALFGRRPSAAPSPSRAFLVPPQRTAGRPGRPGLTSYALLFRVLQSQGVILPHSVTYSGGKCPHAHLAAQAVANVQAINAVKAKNRSVEVTTAQGNFDYESFYGGELDKKHKDK